MIIEKGTVFTLVRPNTSKDVIVCERKGEYYHPIVTEEYQIASEQYKKNGLACFDVIGEAGSENQGQIPGTRVVFLMDIGIMPLADRKHMECGGITRAFTDRKKMETYIERLLLPENKVHTYSRAMEMWGVNTSDSEMIARFIEDNEKYKPVEN